MTMGTNIVVMNEGRIMQQGTPTEIPVSYTHLLKRSFVYATGCELLIVAQQKQATGKRC